MKRETEFAQVQELFDALLHQSDAAREDYLALHSELPSCVVERTQSLLQADDGDGPLPSFSDLL